MEEGDVGAAELTEYASLSMVIILVDFNNTNKRTERESHEVVSIIREMAVGIDHIFKFYWTEDKRINNSSK